jgi:hypothetical protein
MFGYGSPAVPGASSLTAARADAIDRQRIATLAMANRFARRTMADRAEFEFFILFYWLKIYIELFFWLMV